MCAAQQHQPVVALAAGHTKLVCAVASVRWAVVQRHVCAEARELKVWARVGGRRAHGGSRSGSGSARTIAERAGRGVGRAKRARQHAGGGHASPVQISLCQPRPRLRQRGQHVMRGGARAPRAPPHLLLVQWRHQHHVRRVGQQAGDAGRGDVLHKLRAATQLQQPPPRLRPGLRARQQRIKRLLHRGPCVHRRGGYYEVAGGHGGMVGVAGGHPVRGERMRRNVGQRGRRHGRHGLCGRGGARERGVRAGSASRRHAPA